MRTFFHDCPEIQYSQGTGNVPEIKTEVIIMALSNLFGWAKKNEEAAASACGAGDK